MTKLSRFGRDLDHVVNSLIQGLVAYLLISGLGFVPWAMSTWGTKEASVWLLALIHLELAVNLRKASKK